MYAGIQYKKERSNLRIPRHWYVHDMNPYSHKYKLSSKEKLTYLHDTIKTGKELAFPTNAMLECFKALGNDPSWKSLYFNRHIYPFDESSYLYENPSNVFKLLTMPYVDLASSNRLTEYVNQDICQRVLTFCTL
jgi:hypothetical protein